MPCPLNFHPHTESWPSWLVSHLLSWGAVSHHSSHLETLQCALSVRASCRILLSVSICWKKSQHVRRSHWVGFPIHTEVWTPPHLFKSPSWVVGWYPVQFIRRTKEKKRLRPWKYVHRLSSSWCHPWFHWLTLDTSFAKYSSPDCPN